MSNPAHELHDLYSRWRDRAEAKPGPMRAWLRPVDAGNVEVRQAAGLLVRIDEVLTQLEMDGHFRVAVYRRQYPEWWSGVLAYPAGWANNVTAEGVVTSAVMDQIEGFASFLDGKVHVLSGPEIDTLRGTLDRARQLLEADDSLDPQLRMYIHRLLQQIQYALDDEAVGVSFDFAAAAKRLVVAMRAAQGASPKRGAEWGELWRTFATSVLAGGVVEAGGTALRMISGT